IDVAIVSGKAGVAEIVEALVDGKSARVRVVTAKHTSRRREKRLRQVWAAAARVEHRRKHARERAARKRGRVGRRVQPRGGQLVHNRLFAGAALGRAMASTPLAIFDELVDIPG